MTCLDAQTVEKDGEQYIGSNGQCNANQRPDEPPVSLLKWFLQRKAEQIGLCTDHPPLRRNINNPYPRQRLRCLQQMTISYASRISCTTSQTWIHNRSVAC